MKPVLESRFRPGLIGGTTLPLATIVLTALARSLAVVALSLCWEASATTNLQRLSLVSQMELRAGEAWDLAVAGTRAFVASGRGGLAIVDIADPSEPQVIQRVPSLDLSQGLTGIGVSGEYAFMAENQDGLQVLDVRDPSNPRRVASAPVPNAVSVAIAGSTAFVATHSGLVTVDISEPIHPFVLGEFASRWSFRPHVSVNGPLAFLTTDLEVLVLDVTDPGNPVFSGRISVMTDGSRIARSSGHVLLTDATFGLRVVNVSDPSAPRQIGSSRFPQAYDVAIAGNRAFVAGYDSLHVVDLTDPTHPYEVATGSPGFRIATSDRHLLTIGNAQDSTLWLTIEELPPPDSLTVTFLGSDVSVAETNAAVAVSVWRLGSTNQALAVEYFTADGSAVAGQDYQSRSGSIEFAPGERRKTIEIPIFDDSANENREQFSVNLRGLAPEWLSGARTNVSVTVLDNERPPPLLVASRTISAGYAYSLALKEDGSLWTWGSSVFGRDNVPVRIGEDSDWADVSAGGSHGLAIKRDGSLWAWGQNWSGQLGLGHAAGPIYAPTQIGLDQDWVATTVGFDFSLARKADGSLWVWGSNGWGKLGIESINMSLAPVRLGSQTNRWQSASTGVNQAMAIKGDGTLWSWGRNGHGQLGLPGIFSQRTPAQIGSDMDWDVVVIAGGSDTWGNGEANGHTVAIRSDGTLWSWGFNTDYQLGDGTQIERPLPHQAGVDRDWAALAASPNHNVALKTDRSLWTWGANNSGQLGYDTQDQPVAVPSQVEAEHDWVAISAGGTFTLALKSDGSLWSFGEGYDGQLGIGAFTNITTPQRIGSENNWARPLDDPAFSTKLQITEIRASPSRGVQVLLNQTTHRAYYVLYRGSNVTQIQTPVAATLSGPDPVSLTDPHPSLRDAAAFYRVAVIPTRHPLDIDNDGIDDVYELRRRGRFDPLSGDDARQDFDQDGRSNRREYSERTDPAVPQDWRVVAAGLNYSLSLKSDRTLWAWGANDFGQLGDGTTTFRERPIQIGTNADWASIAVSSSAISGAATIALKMDGTVWGWGSWFSRPAEPAAPARLSAGADGFSAVAAGNRFAVAVAQDGRLLSWGSSPVEPPETVRPAPGLETCRAVSAGAGHILAIKTNGTLWAFGDNLVSQCGLGTGSTDQPAVKFWTQVGTGESWTAIAASGDGDIFDGSHSLALRADGTLWAWGSNWYGECAQPQDFDLIRVPTQVASGTNWIAVAAACGRSMARQRDGTLWIWGTAFGPEPMRLSESRDWRSFAAGGTPLDGFVLAIKDDGSLWRMGVGETELTRVGTDADWGSIP